MGAFKVTMLDKTGKEHNRSIRADMSGAALKKLFRPDRPSQKTSPGGGSEILHLSSL